MRPRTRALLIGLPLAELAAAMGVAALIGWGWTIILLLACSVVGLGILANAGSEAFASLRSDAGLRSSGTGWRAVAGALIALPGFLSAIAGAMLLAPRVQRALSRRLRGTGTVTVVEGMVIREESPRPDPVNHDGPNPPRGELGPS